MQSVAVFVSLTINWYVFHNVECYLTHGLTKYPVLGLPTFEPVWLQKSVQSFFFPCLVKLEHGYSTRFAAMLQNKLHVFCCPFYHRNPLLLIGLQSLKKLLKLRSFSIPEKSPRSDLKLVFVFFLGICSGIFYLIIDNSLQFEPVVGDMSSERSRSMELAEKIARKEPLDINKVL